MKQALITGITGQDGSYLTEFLLDKGYDVHGIIRRRSTFNTGRIEHLYQDPHGEDVRLFLHYGDLSDASNISRLLEKINPDEIYHLGAQSHVRVSFDIPEYTADVTAVGTLSVLDAIRETGIHTKFYQAASSEMFGKAQEIPQKETTPFYPRSPYGCAKVFAYWNTRNYRESYGLFAGNGILFNHESPRRGETFVTRKITRGLARMRYGLDDCLYLGNLDAKRDWGYAKDYVRAMWMMLQQAEPDDYVIATNETHSVREFVELAFRYLGSEIEWQGSGTDEIGIDQDTGKMVVRIDPRCSAPNASVQYLIYIGSSCMYPKDFDKRLKEEHLLAAPLEPTNEGYALAKISGAKLCEYCSKQYGVHYKSLIPCNLYGPGDHFDPRSSHLIAAIIEKIHRAKTRGEETIPVWGDGSARREFLYVDDLVDFICDFLSFTDKLPNYLNVGYGKDFTVLEYHRIAAEVMGYDGEFTFDTSRPVGMSWKLLDSTRAYEFGWNPKTSLKEGIRKTYDYYLSREQESAIEIPVG